MELFYWMSDKPPAIGIDLGTTNCCVAYLYPDNHVDIIENELGCRTTPSYISFTNDSEIIGKLAKEKAFRTAENVVYYSKRLIGRLYDDKYLKRNLEKWTFNVICDNNDNTPLIQISRSGENVNYKPHEISAKLLKHLKQAAEARLGKDVKDAVITVPAHFNYHQRTATKLAGALAGLNVIRIINEPTAAALAYVHKNQITDCENLLIFDLGGGTFDVSLVTVKEKTIAVRATSGNTHLGGRDFDNNLSNFIVEQIESKFKKKINDNKKIMQRIEAHSEKLKINLSYETEKEYSLPLILDEEDLEITISRNEFEVINRNLFEQCIITVKDCLNEANVSSQSIHKILLIGGSSRIPKLRSMLKNLFNSQTELLSAINPDEAVAYGAAVQAAMLSKGDKLEVVNEIVDITSLSIGTHVAGDLMHIITPRNIQIPITKYTSYSTACGTQSSMAFNIFAGERPLVKYNTMIGKCSISFPPKPLEYRIHFQMHINANGILEVEGKTEGGIYTKLELKSEKHPAHEVNDVVQDASENKASDDKKVEIIRLWVGLADYSVKIEAICFYKSEHINNEDKHILTTQSQLASDWLEANKVVGGSQGEKDAILNKTSEIETVCEPILKKYGYQVKNMNLTKFHKFITH